MSLKKIDYVFYEKAGAKVHEKRKKLGYSLRYLSETTGISKTTLDLFELGRVRVTPATFEVICKALNLTPKINVDVKIGES